MNGLYFIALIVVALVAFVGIPWLKARAEAPACVAVPGTSNHGWTCAEARVAGERKTVTGQTDIIDRLNDMGRALDAI